MAKQTVRRRPAPRRIERSRGFTMIDVLVAAAILMLMLGGLSFTTLSIIETNTQARRQTAAAQLAQDRLEWLRAQSVAGLAAGADPQALSEDGTPGGAGAMFTRSWTVSAGPVADSVVVTVTVTWTDKVKTHRKQLQALLTDA